LCWPRKKSKFTLMLLRLSVDSSSCVNWDIVVLDYCMVFRNNVWITECVWLYNMSTYSLAEIRSWRVIIGPTECHDIVAQTITELLRLSLL
jgi:hypothetical protein